MIESLTQNFPPFAVDLVRLCVWLAILTLAYVAISWLAFVPWHDNAGQRSAGIGPPPANQRAIVIASSIAVFFATAVGILVMMNAPALRRP